MTITEEIFATCHFTEISHGHGPGMWVYVYLCTEHPRLQIKDVGERKAKRTTRTYLVDGLEKADRAAAVAALNVPVVITPEEQALLDALPTDWTPLPTPRVPFIEAHHSLRCKGQIEFQNRQYRRRPQP